MKKGFTLVELLVVITILAVLAGTALPFVQSYVEESRVAKAKADLEEISRALVVYETREGEYPDTDVKLLAGRYLNKSPIDPWGSSYLVNKTAGTVFSPGPDRTSDLANPDDPENADNIVVAYQPPLALVSAKWVDRNQNGVFDAENVPDQLLLTFSRKIDATPGCMAQTVLNSWLRISYNGAVAPVQISDPAGDGKFVQSYQDPSSPAYVSTPDVLTSSKDVLLSLMSPYNTNATTKVVMGKAYLVIDDPKGGDGNVDNGNEIKDLFGNLALSSQKVLIIPQ